MNKNIIHEAKILFDYLEQLNETDLIDTINELRKMLHKYSPFKKEPVDCVQWIKVDQIIANDYNPNVVAPPEMLLLEQSIKADGYTQPLVVWEKESNYEVVDGFHRHRVGRECKAVNERVNNHLPVSVINIEREGRSNRIAATIRHNRARGKHKVDSMSDIIIELKNRNWTNKRIAKELGMEQDEILRLCQITGLTELFSDQEFSKSWDIEGDIDEHDFDALSDDIETYDSEETKDFRVVNTNDDFRIFHTWDKWECYKAGLYKTSNNGMSKEEGQKAYRDFLSDTAKLAKTLEKIIIEWKYSCEHYLTNRAMNRIAWLGQASMCYATGVPATFRAGFYLLSEKQQKQANETALIYLNKWLLVNGGKELTLEEAMSYDRQSDIY